MSAEGSTAVREVPHSTCASSARAVVADYEVVEAKMETSAIKAETLIAPSSSPNLGALAMSQTTAIVFF